MLPPVAPMAPLTICGLDELASLPLHEATHVLSLLDPGWPDPDAFVGCATHRRTTLHFHDEIEPGPGVELPQVDHVRAILAFGAELAEEARKGHPVRALVHCHMGISRSTAAVACILAQQGDADAAFARLGELRVEAWPNCLMIAIADDLLGYAGRFTAALGRFYAKELANDPDLAQIMRDGGRGREVDLADAANREADARRHGLEAPDGNPKPV
jgi:predicted protein tyrosine phosphatase